MLDANTIFFWVNYVCWEIMMGEVVTWSPFSPFRVLSFISSSNTRENRTLQNVTDVYLVYNLSRSHRKWDTIHKHFKFYDINSCLQFQRVVLTRELSSPRSNENNIVLWTVSSDLTITASKINKNNLLADLIVFKGNIEVANSWYTNMHAQHEALVTELNLGLIRKDKLLFKCVFLFLLYLQ